MLRWNISLQILLLGPYAGDVGEVVFDGMCDHIQTYDPLTSSMLILGGFQPSDAANFNLWMVRQRK
jgi:hypothetical protein